MRDRLNPELGRRDLLRVLAVGAAAGTSAFNPADAAITIGVLILLLRALLVRQARLTETK